MQTKEVAGVLEKPPKPELANIFREFGHAYRKTHPMPLSHIKVMHAVEV